MAEEVIARNPEIFAKELWSLKNQKMLCDAVLIVNEERIDVHSVVLASSSEYFKSLFVESAMKEITFTDIDKEAVEFLIEYCYTGKLKITEKNMNEVIRMASMLSIVFESSLLIEKLTVANCLSIWKIAQSGDLKQLENAAFEFAITHFEGVSQSKEFLNLEKSDLREYLSSELSIKSEVIIYDAIKKWINHDSDSRKIYMIDLLDIVKLECLPLEFLSSESLSICNMEAKCWKKFMEAIDSHKKNCSTVLNTLLAVGATDVETLKSMEVYDLTREKWHEIPINCNRTGVAVSLLDTKLILIGGVLNRSPVNIVESYDMKSGQMETLSSMKYVRRWLTTVQNKGYIFAIGGYDGTNSLSSAEMWDPLRNSWSDIASLNIPRRAFGACVLKEEIFVAGGYNKSDDENSVEAYNFSTKAWRLCSPLNVKRRAFGMATVGEYIYVVAGCNTVNLDSVERYDQQIDKWIMVEQILVARWFLAAGHLNGKLAVAGGNVNGTNVEKYDEENKKWTSMTPLKKNRSEFNLIEVPWTLAEAVLSKIS